MNTLLTKIIKGGLLAAVVAIPLSVLAINTDSAEAATTGGTISCGAAVCSVNTNAQATNSSFVIPDTSGGGSSGGGSGGAAAPSPYSYTKESCASFLPIGGGSTSHSYPAINSSSYNCYLARGSGFGGGSGFAPYCPPKSDRAANGAVYKFYTDPATGKATLISYYCAYPTDAYAPIERKSATAKTYVSGDGKFHNVSSSQQATVYNQNGLLTDSIHKEIPFNAANPPASPNLNQDFDAATGTRADGTPLYGFYRVTWVLQFKLCDQYSYPAWLGIAPRWSCSDGSENTVQPYTYACNIGDPALRAGIVDGALFTPSKCQTGWQCNFSKTISINGVSDALSVMRNGDRIPTEFGATPTITGAVINGRNIKYLDNVVAGSTPYQGKNDNDPKQLFAKYNKIDNKERFGQWLPVNNNSQSQFLSFYWASDDHKSWQMTRQYSFTADFLVSVQNSVNGASTGKYVTDFTNCPETATSAAVEVVRAVNN
jgi:hypothetical protein